MSKYKIKTLALLSAIPFLFTACTLQDLPVIGSFFGGGTKGPVELTMWGLWEKDYVFNPVVAKYQAEYPETSLSYEDMSVLNLSGLVEYKKRVFSRMEQSEWDADIVMVHNSWMPLLIELGYLEPMPADLMDANTFSNIFYPIAAEDAVSGGSIYGIPAYYDGLALVYNKDHFEEIGQTSPPTAWEEFRRIAIDLTQTTEGESGEIIRAGAAIGAANNIAHFTDILGLMWAQAGVQVPEGIDSVPAQDAFSFYISLLQDHNIWREDFPEASTAFANEQVSMIFVPSWQILDIIRANPGLNIGVAPVPQALANNPVSWGSYWMYVVPANADSKAAAWNFVNYLSTEDAQETMFREASKVREFGVPSALVSMQGEVASNPYLAAYVQTAPFAKGGVVAARSGNALQERLLMEAMEKYLADTTNTLTIADVLKEAKEAMLQ